MNMLPMKHSFTYRKFLVLEQVFSPERQPLLKLLMKRLITQIKQFFSKKPDPVHSVNDIHTSFSTHAL